MALRKFFSIALRNLVRNGRRTVLTGLAVALGLMAVMMMAGMIEGNMVDDGIRISTGHMQIRSLNYDESRESLLAEDLLRDGEGMAAQVGSVAAVESAAPVLWFGGLLSTSQESTGIQIMGINMEDTFHAPIREGVVAGAYLSNEDRRMVLLGSTLAEQMDIGVGDRISIAAGSGQEGIFTVAGLVDTGFPSIDQNRIIMPLEQAQAFSGVGDRVSALIVMLYDEDEADEIAAALAEQGVETLTWRDLNSIILESVEMGLVFYYILYGIVFLAVAVLIANTLLMSVFARAREIGILGSLGMNRRQIILLFLAEASLLAVFGIAIGLVLGYAVVAYMTYVGISIPAETAALVEGFPMGTTLYSDFAPMQFAVLSLMLLVIVIVVSLYPAWFAAKMEPVDALQSL